MGNDGESCRQNFGKRGEEIMTLLISVFAAIAVTVIWYTNEKARKMKISYLCWMFWGASLMWLVDAIFEYVSEPEEYFNPAVKDMLNDAFLGLCVVALALVIWIVSVLVSDPLGVVKRQLKEEEARE